MRRVRLARNMKLARLTLAPLSPKRGASMAYTLTAEKPEHADAIERVLARAFGPGRFAKTSERVRERGAVPEPMLTRVALNDEGDIDGVCRIWLVEAGAPVYFLGPLAVDPSQQSAGLGIALVREVVAACRASGGNGIILVGAEPFFRPAGFTIVPKGRLSMPGPVDPARFLWLTLRPGGLDKIEGEIAAPKR
ncbi:MAG: N-acetyltransferase [Hyphomonadaceae bacterium]